MIGPKHQLALLEESLNACRLAIHGLKALQEISPSNDFYYKPFLLLSNGVEKYLKIILCYHHWNVYQKFPVRNDFREKGENGMPIKGSNAHDLICLNRRIIEEVVPNNAFINQLERNFLNSQDGILSRVLYNLSEFGKYSRFYYLDVVMNHPDKIPENVYQNWDKLELDIIKEDDELYRKFISPLISGEKKIDVNALYEIDSGVNTTLTSAIELYMRVLTKLMLKSFGGEAASTSTHFRRFLMIDDESLGTTDYRKINDI